MCYQFIILFGHDGSSGSATSNPQHLKQALLSKGLRCRWESSSAKLFASDQTPTLVLPGGQVLIGHLFNREFKPVTDTTFLTAFSRGRTLQSSVLEECWGEYILIHQDPGRPSSIRVDRDPSGGVSCVYSLHGANGFITSDLSIATFLGLIDKRIDWQHLAHGLAYPGFKTGHTGLVDISELLPGCSLTIEGTTAVTKCEWTPWRHVTCNDRHEEPREAADVLRKVIVSVVRAWAGIDKSVLLELSGGLDSSIVGICLRNTEARVACSTLVAAVPGTDERAYAGLVANLLGSELRSEELSLDFARLDFKVPAHSVTPSIGLLQHEMDNIKEAVALHLSANAHYSGGGGDTVFCYLGTAAPAADAFRERGLACGLAAIRNLAKLHQCTAWKVARMTARKLFRSHQPLSGRDVSFLSPLLDISSEQQHPWFPAPANTLHGDKERVLDLAGTQAFRDSVPRARNRWFRMPLLSQPVVEACLRVPSWMWISDGHDRSVARTAFSELLPREIVDRRSKGTFMNYWGAAYRRNRTQMREFLLTGRLQSCGILDADAVRKAFEDPATPRDQSLMRLFDLCKVENWARQQE